MIDFMRLAAVVAAAAAVLDSRRLYAADGNAGAQSIGDRGHAAETVEFPENRAGATFTMPGSTVVRMATAIRCAEEHSIDLQLPTAVIWFEL